MKRFACFLTLLVCLSFSAFAVPKVDGIFGPREYNETLATLQIPQHESNNNLSFAYLHWVASPADYSVYLSLQYKCSDYAMEDGRTGVTVFINDDPVGTLFADNTTEDVDHSRFELEGFLDDGASVTPHESFCELRVGIKFWPAVEIYIGVQILDFSGNPSNYYRQLVYSPYTESTKAGDSATPRSTTTEKSTAVQTTAIPTTTAAQTTARTTTARTTTQVVTAPPTRESTATTAAVSAVQTTVLQPIVPPTGTASTSKPKKAKTTKAATAARTDPRESSATAATTEATAAAVLPATTEASASETAVETVSSAQMYREMNKVKIVGTVLVAVILTAAIMSSVFLGMRQRKDEPPVHTPQEEYDDFG